MPVDGVAGERPIIGLVVADDESVLGLQPFQERPGEAVVRIPQDPHMPGPGPAAPDRREAVHRHDDRRMAGRHGPVDRIRDGIVVGIVEPGDAPLHLRLVHPGIARHDGAVGEAHDQGRVVPAPVGIDDEPREPGEDRRSPEAPGERAGHGRRADVVGDVALELGFRQAEIAQIRRHRVGSVVAQDQDARFDGPEMISTGQGSRGRLVEPERGGSGHGARISRTDGLNGGGKALPCPSNPDNATFRATDFHDRHVPDIHHGPRRFGLRLRFCRALPRRRGHGDFPDLRAFRLRRHGRGAGRCGALRQRLLARLALPAPALCLDANRGEASARRRAEGPLLQGEHRLAASSSPGDLFFWHLAILKTTVANATFFATMAPLFVVLTVWLVFRQQVSRGTFMGLALCLLGGAALIGQSLQADPARIEGDLYGVATAFFFGMYFLAASKARKTAGAARVTFEAGLITSAILLVIAVLFDTRVIPQTAQGIAALLAMSYHQPCGRPGASRHRARAAAGSLLVPRDLPRGHRRGNVRLG